MNGGAALCRIAVVVPEQAAEAFPALDLADLLTELAARGDDPIPQPLVVPFPMVMDGELRQRPFQ